MSMNIGGASPSDPVDEIEEVITRLLELIAPRRNRHLYKEMFTTISSMASADTDTLDLKIIISWSSLVQVQALWKLGCVAQAAKHQSAYRSVYQTSSKQTP